MQHTITKFKFKADAVVINAPTTLMKDLKLFNFAFVFPTKKKSTNTLIFLNDSKDLMQFLKKDITKIEADSVLWLAYPKGSSKIKTDINRDAIRITAETFGITTVTAISINDTWSALRFRPIEKVGT